VPFTGSHPAAVLPFARSAMPASALAIGSMSPDHPLYLPTPYTEKFSHGIVGVVTVDLICGLAVFLLWRWQLRPFAVEYAPSRIAGLVAPARPSHPLWLIAGLCLGALTHVVWDSFTHADGWGVRLIPPLTARVGRLPAYELAQYASTLLGAVVLVAWIGRWKRRARPATGGGLRPGPATPSRTMVYGIVVSVMVIAAVAGYWYGLSRPDPIRAALFHAATKSADAGVAAVLVLAVARSVRRRRARTSVSAPKDRL
jgi:hypothetical protein